MENEEEFLVLLDTNYLNRVNRLTRKLFSFLLINMSYTQWKFHVPSEMHEMHEYYNEIVIEISRSSIEISAGI